MSIKLKKYKYLLLVIIMLSVTFPSLVFSYTNIEISNISFKKTNDEKLRIEWRTNLKTEGHIDYGKNENALSNRMYEKNVPRELHVIEIDDLEDGEIYYFQIVSKNSVKVVRSEVFERYIDVRLNKVFLNSDLKIDNFSKKSTTDQGTVSFETNYPSAGSLVIKRNNLLIRKIDFPFSINHNVVITNLSPDVCYDLYIDLKSKYNQIYSSNYNLCTLRRSVLPVSRSGYWDYEYKAKSSQSFTTDSNIIVAGIMYERYPGIQAIYKTIDSPKIWLIANNQRHLITSPRSFEDYGFSWGDVQTVTWPEIVQYKLAKLVKAPDSTIVYFLHERKDGTFAKIAIPSSDVFDSYPGNRREDIVTISQLDIDSYVNVALVKSLSNGDIYYISGNVKHYIAKNILGKYYFKYDDVLLVNTIHLSRYEAGDGLE